jgi:PAS domain S-box-containing protein
VIAPQIPADETERLEDLRNLQVLDTEAEERFDRVTRLAQGLFETPIALVSLIDQDRQWFKSRQGLAATQTPRDFSFCGHAILDDGVLVVPDATKDIRFSDNPLVTGDPDIRFYAGAPLKTDTGNAVGTLCVIDTRPREWTDAQSAALRDLADLVELELNQTRMRNQQRALLALTAVTGLVEDDPSELLRAAMRVGCEYLNMPEGLVGRVRGDDFEVIVSHSVTGDVDDGQHYAVSDVFCEFAMEGTDVVALPHISGTALADHPSHVTWGLESYIGVPIVIEGAHFGTVAFESTDPRPGNRFAAAEVDFVRLLGRWAATSLRRWQLNDQVVHQQRISDMISRAQSRFIRIDDRSMAFDGLLEDILDLTSCTFGFIGEVLQRPDGSPFLRTHAITDIAWNAATREWYDRYRDSGLEFDNPDTLFGRTLTSGTHVLSNDARHDPRSGGIPAGHPVLSSYLGLPVHHGGQMIGMVGLANKSGGFFDDDMQALEPVLVTVGQLIAAWKSKSERLEDQKSIDRLSKVARQMTNGVIITSLDGRVEWANEAFTSMTDYPFEQIVGRRPREILHGPDTDPETEQAIYAAMSRRVPFQYELLAYRRGGAPIWVELESNPLVARNGEHEGFMVMVSDIGERKRIDRMKSEFVSTVSHELRTPLTSINGALRLVAAGVAGELPPKARQMVVIAEKNGTRLAHLIDDLLDMEKLVEGKVRFDWQVTDLMSIVDRAVTENQAFADNFNVDLVVMERVEGVLVDVDIMRVQQVLSNLLSNAAKFSHPRGMVEVRVRELDARVRVEVIDFGRGISPQFESRIFEKFSQADSSDSRVQGGTGLGLAISRELVERMDGSIAFTSKYGRGTTFYFELPVAVPIDKAKA